MNLLPSQQPNDIYQDVADAAKLLVEEDARQGHTLAKQLLEFGIDRKILWEAPGNIHSICRKIH